MSELEANPERDIDRRSPNTIAASLRDAVMGKTLLVGPGQFSPHSKHERIFIIAVDEEPTILWDRFYPEKDIGALRNALRSYARVVFEGEHDAMYATAWSFAWTCPPAPLRVYDRSGIIVAVDDDVLRLGRSDGRVAIPVIDIACIEGWLSGDWVKRQVRIVTTHAEWFVVAECTEWFVMIDPTYDGIDLMCDASWVGQLGHAMAKALGVPYNSDDSALQ
ncbi:MAG: hypothetical protein IPM54_38270 [Polyangiaceae bacterium]|nr:hypothetical protein [Polyangiaceae bacterium]